MYTTNQTTYRTVAALRPIPTASRPYAADGKFQPLYRTADGAEVFGYIKPESVHAGITDADYQVIVRFNVAVDCDCPDSCYRGHDCKHMSEFNDRRRAAEALFAEVMLPGAPQPDGLTFTAAQVAALLQARN